MSISNLLGTAWTGLQELGRFLSILVLGIFIAIVYALPWILRGLAVLAWFLAGFFAITEIEGIYAPTLSSPIPVYALQLAAILILLAWPVAGMLLALRGRPGVIWGLIAVGALVVGGLFWKVLPWLRITWPETADLILSLLPLVAFMVILIVMTLRFKIMNSGGGIKLAVPAFIWLRRVGAFSNKGELNSREPTT